MARGRMLNNSISVSKKFHDLPDDTCRLLATWIISHLDVNGVFHGDPAIVKSYVFPRRSDVTDQQVMGYLQVMERIGLIVLFDARGDLWQWWPGFADEQVGLRIDRETTKFPPPPVEIPPPSGNETEESQQDTGNLPAEEKLSEVEEKSSEKTPTVNADAPPPPASKPKNTRKPSKKQLAAQQMFTALAAVCQIDVDVLTGDQRGQLNQSEKMLRERKDATPSDLSEFSLWWSAHDWRGERGQPPRPAQVREVWGQFEEWRRNGRPAAKGQKDVGTRQAVPVAKGLGERA